MSTFGGLMQEYQLVSIDRFDGRNLESSVYMLSHIHSDHTTGMHSADFKYRLFSNNQIKLYCSHITRDLLMLDSRYRPIEASIVSLDINCPHLIDIPDPELGTVKCQVTVTLLQAGHCPGSVMFLFEGDEGKALYTGDFRLTKQNFMSFEHLRTTSGVKAIQSVYIDTTFCVPQAMFIPSREDTTQAAIDLVRDWLDRDDPANVVHLKYRADVGYENLFVCLCEEFNMKIHVDNEKFEKYKSVGDLAEFVTTDGGSTRIHACQRCNCEQVSSGSSTVRTLLFSTMCFIHQVALDVYTIRISDRFYRVCYSFHSSYSEIRDAIFYLRPRRAFPNVVPKYEDKVGADSRMQKRLDEFVRLARECITPEASVTVGYRELGQLKQPKSHALQNGTTKHLPSKLGSSRLIFGTDDTQQSLAASTSSKRSRIVNDSIDFLADLRESQLHPSISPSDGSSIKSGKFRMLFGGSQDSAELSEKQGSQVAGSFAQELSDVGSEVEKSSGEDSQATQLDYMRNNPVGLGDDFEGMTQDDRIAIHNFKVTTNGRVMSYMGDDYDDIFNIDAGEEQNVENGKNEHVKQMHEVSSCDGLKRCNSRVVYRENTASDVLRDLFDEFEAVGSTSGRYASRARKRPIEDTSSGVSNKVHVKTSSCGEPVENLHHCGRGRQSDGKDLSDRDLSDSCRQISDSPLVEKPNLYDVNAKLLNVAKRNFSQDDVNTELGVEENVDASDRELITNRNLQSMDRDKELSTAEKLNPDVSSQSSYRTVLSRQAGSQGSDEFKTPASRSSETNVVILDDDGDSVSAAKTPFAGGSQSQPPDSDSTVDAGPSPTKNVRPHNNCKMQESFDSDATTTDNCQTPLKSKLASLTPVKQSETNFTENINVDVVNADCQKSDDSPPSPTILSRSHSTQNPASYSLPEFHWNDFGCENSFPAKKSCSRGIKFSSSVDAETNKKSELEISGNDDGWESYDGDDERDFCGILRHKRLSNSEIILISSSDDADEVIFDKSHVTSVNLLPSPSSNKSSVERSAEVFETALLTTPAAVPLPLPSADDADNVGCDELPACCSSPNLFTDSSSLSCSQSQ